MERFHVESIGPEDREPLQAALVSARAALAEYRRAMKHISEAEYMREAERLTALRDELRGALMVEPIIHIEGMAEAWAKGNAARRRQLVTVMFDRLLVRDGEIINYIPRTDRDWRPGRAYRARARVLYFPLQVPPTIRDTGKLWPGRRTGDPEVLKPGSEGAEVAQLGRAAD